MSAHCHDCGADLVFGTGEDWQLMTCPQCDLTKVAQAERDRADRYEYALTLLIASGGGGFTVFTREEQTVVEDCITAAIKRRREAASDV